MAVSWGHAANPAPHGPGWHQMEANHQVTLMTLPRSATSTSSLKSDGLLGQNEPMAWQLFSQRFYLVWFSAHKGTSLRSLPELAELPALVTL